MTQRIGRETVGLRNAVPPPNSTLYRRCDRLDRETRPAKRWAIPYPNLGPSRRNCATGSSLRDKVRRKSARYGTEMALTDRFYPSSPLRFAYDVVNAGLGSDLLRTCPACQACRDRHENAALKRPDDGDGWTPGGSGMATGNDACLSPAKREMHRTCSHVDSDFSVRRMQLSMYRGYPRAAGGLLRLGSGRHGIGRSIQCLRTTIPTRCAGRSQPACNASELRIRLTRQRAGGSGEEKGACAMSMAGGAACRRWAARRSPSLSASAQTLSA